METKMRIAIIAGAIAIFMFGLSTVADAAVVYFDTANPNVLPGETISVTIFSTVETDRIRMDRISDADFGIASNLYLNPGYDPPLNEGVVVNESGVLIEGVNTGISSNFPAVYGVLYSFDYTVPSAEFGQIITIFADSSYGAVNQVWCDIGIGLDPIAPEALSLTVVPEPASIVLLGLGLLLVRKIKRSS
jgi:hypothetical protein